MDIYLAGTPIEKLFGEISCGDVDIQGVKVIIPSDRYESLLGRIESFDSTKWENKNKLFRFLAYRCDGEFLSRYIARHPAFISSLSMGSYLYAVSDVDVIVRLHEFGLLPEQKRLEVVNEIKELAVNTPDAGFLREEIRKLLTKAEQDEILEHVRKILLPDLNEHIRSWRWNHNSEDDPEEYFSELIGALKDYREEFKDYADAVTQLDNALAKIDEVIEELRSEMPEEPDSDDYYGRNSVESGQETSRSVFEDVDL
jgi:hypothetical protein